MMHNSRIAVFGSTGMVGSALVRELIKLGFNTILTPRHSELDLRDAMATRCWFTDNYPAYIFMPAATVGGIDANNSRPVDFLENNLVMSVNVISAAGHCLNNKLMFFGSSCIYPKFAPQPMKPEHLLTGPLEPTNEWYGLAKIAALKLCQAYRKQHNKSFISVMPTNLYGPGDNYRPGCHVIPALIDRFHKAKSETGPVKVWGNGNVLREFLYVEDLARACILLMDSYDDYDPVNIGSGMEFTIRELASTIARTVGLDPARLTFDPDQLTGTPRKLLDSTRINCMGWQPQTDLSTGLERAYNDYVSRIRS